MQVVILQNREPRTVEGIEYPRPSPMSIPVSYDQGDRGPHTTILTVRSFDYGIYEALRDTLDHNVAVLSSPGIGLTRIQEGSNASSINDSSFDKRYFTASSIQMGYTRRGNPVVAYAHIPISLANPSTVYRLTYKDSRSLKGGAAPIPNEEFLSVLENEGNGVIIVDHAALITAGSGSFSLEQAAQHPQTRGFFNGDQASIEQYLKIYQRVSGRDEITIRFGKTDFPSDNSLAWCRFLVLGNRLDHYDTAQFDANKDVNTQHHVKVLGALPPH